MQGTWPPTELLDTDAYHWLHSERASSASIAQWMGNLWFLIGEAQPLTPAGLRLRGWEYLGPCERPHSRYIDD